MRRELKNLSPRTRLTGQQFEGNSEKNSINNDNQFSKLLPPYGKEAAFLLSWGVQPRNDIFIFAGLNAWQKAKAFGDTQVVLCLPLGTDPSIYFWPVKDCSILLIDTGGLNITDVEKISYHLLLSSASIVRAVLVNYTLVVYRRDTA